MICPKCKTENRDQAKFCDECGFPLSNMQDQVIEDFDSQFDEARLQALDALYADEISENMSERPESTTSNFENPVIEDNELDYEGGEKATFVDLPDVGLPLRAILPPDEPDENTQTRELVDRSDLLNNENDGFDVADEDSKPTTESQMVEDTPSDNDTESQKAIADETDLSDVTRSIDLSGFVFDDDSPDGETNNGAYLGDNREPAGDMHQFETNVIPRAAIWGADKTDVLPCITDVEPEQNMKVSAPANKKEERERRKEMRKHDKEARKKLREANPAKKSAILIAILVVLAIAVLGVGVSYFLELWGGKTVPSTIGMTEADAIYTLQNSGFNVKVDEVKSDDTAGLVLLSDPSDGSRLPEGSEIVIHVSSSRIIPNVVGMKADEAKALIEQEGYVNIGDFEYVKTNSAAEGTVLEVSPQAGSVAKSNARVSIKVATPYRVPDVAGMTQDNATYTLREAGYYVYISQVENSAVAEGTVCYTDPEANTQLDEDSYVTIYVAVQRATKLVAAARSYLSSLSTITIGGTTYVINSVSSVSYSSNGVVNFTITGSPTTTFLGESITLSSRSVSGSLKYDDNNQLLSVS